QWFDLIALDHVKVGVLVPADGEQEERPLRVRWTRWNGALREGEREFVPSVDEGQTAVARTDQFHGIPVPRAPARDVEPPVGPRAHTVVIGRQRLVPGKILEFGVTTP